MVQYYEMMNTNNNIQYYRKEIAWENKAQTCSEAIRWTPLLSITAVSVATPSLVATASLPATLSSPTSSPGIKAVEPSSHSASMKGAYRLPLGGPILFLWNTLHNTYPFSTQKKRNNYYHHKINLQNWTIIKVGCW